MSAAEGRASMKSKVRQAVTPTIPERLGVGSTIEAKCTKCKAILPHVVVAKIGAVPTRVQCATCSMLHAYSVPRRKARSETEGDVQAAGGAGAWRDALRRARGASVLYSKRERYLVGSRLTHATFGEGVVLRVSSTTVCEVIFETGPVKLLMGS